MQASVTIAEVAKAAGVSSATVDRVLNGRGSVNAQTAARVREALERLGGSIPSPGRPRSTSSYRFGYVLPDTRAAFFDAIDRVIAQSAGEFRHRRITVVTLRLPAHDPSAFALELARLKDFSGLAVLAPDTAEVRAAIDQLVAAGVHVVTLFSDVSASRRSAYLGQDNRTSGRTAALLLSIGCRGGEAPRTALFAPPARYAAEADRQTGFLEYMAQHFGAAAASLHLELPETDEDAYRYCLRRLPRAASPRALQVVYNVGAASFGIARALAEQGYQARALLAVHELVEVHRAMLSAGQVEFVLHQDIYEGVSRAARILRALADDVRGASGTFHCPRVAVVTRENIG